MRVLSRMVLGKLLTFTIFINCHAQSWESPSREDYVRSDTVPSVLFNVWNTFSMRIKESDRQKHEQAVYYALENLDNGETIKWLNPQTNSSGQIQIAVTWMNGGLSCRRIYSSIRTEKFNKSFSDTACYNPSTNVWRFLNKY